MEFLGKRNRNRYPKTGLFGADKGSFCPHDEVVALTEDELLRKELLSQYFSDILTKDIVERYRVKDVSKLRNLALFYSTNFTRSYSFNKVKKVADFSLSLDAVHRFSHYKVLYF